MKPTLLTIDTELLRALCIYDMTGKVGMKQMVIYGVGYAQRKFKINDKTVQNTHIDYDQLHIHALMASFIMM